ncbi:unnamed protein product [Blepharisma stoltei]|uniref:Uncharacterized protein n=1 Tax=Blepharisma stoltei TaxID=1481888 RepID=A0AAU9JX85_9CILI|nr:unnamed protein product [Blepharisma stoltei]
MGCGSIQNNFNDQAKESPEAHRPYPADERNKLPKVVLSSFDSILQKGTGNKKPKPAIKTQKSTKTEDLSFDQTTLNQLNKEDQKIESLEKETINEIPEPKIGAFIEEKNEQDEGKKIEIVDTSKVTDDGRISPGAPKIEDMYEESEEVENVDVERLKSERAQKELAAQEEAKAAVERLKEQENADIAEKKEKIDAMEGEAFTILSKYT